MGLASLNESAEHVQLGVRTKPHPKTSGPGRTPWNSHPPILCFLVQIHFLLSAHKQEPDFGLVPKSQGVAPACVAESIRSSAIAGIRIAPIATTCTAKAEAKSCCHRHHHIPIRGVHATTLHDIHGACSRPIRLVRHNSVGAIWFEPTNL